MQNELSKLNAILNKCNKLYNFNSFWITKDEVENLICLFLKTRENLIIQNPQLFDGYNVSNYQQYYKEDNMLYEKIVLNILNQDISYYTDIIASSSSLGLPNIALTKEGVYFSGQFFDATSKLTEIINSAKDELIIIDGYISDKNLKMLTTSKSKKIIIITQSKSLNPSLNTLIEEFNKQFGNRLEVKTSNEFHDRFIIIDRKEFYHIGASIKDAGNKGFMFSIIEEPFIKISITEELKKLIK